jgi:hypothetical protein
MTDFCPVQAPKLAARLFQGEAIIINPATSELFSLNETATVIWLAADGSATLREIVERRIVPEFDVDPEEALRDAVELTRGLADKGILTFVPPPKD